MPTLIYAPGVRAYISTEKHGVLDISEDISSFNLVRRTDGVSTFDCSIQNIRRKYDGKFSPNDRIVVLLKRVTWLRVFTGYLNSVPLITAWPRDVPLSASCSLKRLQYWYWDPDSTQTMQLLLKDFNNQKADTSSATPNERIASAQVVRILREVVGWPEEKIHIGKIPANWYNIAASLAKATIPQTLKDLEDATTVLGDISALSEGANQYYTGGLEPLFESSAAAGSLGSSELGASGTFDFAVSSGAVARGTLPPGRYDAVSLNEEQVKYAELIYGIAAQRGDLNKRDVVIAIATAMQESKLSNLNYGDMDSLGLFQQRPSAGWGSPKQILNPEYAINKFYDALIRIPNRNKMSPEWRVSSAVQRPDEAYVREPQRWVGMARAVVAKIDSNIKSQGPSGTVGGTQAPSRGSATGGEFLAAALKLVNDHKIPYTQKYEGTNLDIISQNPPPGLDCSSFVQAVMLRTLGTLKGLPRRAVDQAKHCTRISVRQALHTQGALLFRSKDGKSIGAVNHVEISVGNGRDTVGAKSTGKNAGVTSSAESYWHLGGLLPEIKYGGTVGQGGGPAGQSGAGYSSLGGNGYTPVDAPIGTRFRKPGSWKIGFHTGVDFPVEVGTSVKSVTNGVVIQAGSAGAYGNLVVVSTQGLQFYYAHLSSISVTKGQKVTLGQQVGLSGNSGNTTGPHLHFEIRKAPWMYSEESFIDPEKFINNGVRVAEGGEVSEGFGGLVSQGLSAVNDAIAASQWSPLPLGKDAPGYNPNDQIDLLFGESPWFPVPPNSVDIATAETMVGQHALVNDSPLLPYLRSLMGSTLRSMCSAPNGDLIAWFPDYYGLWGTAATLRLEPIEVIDFNITWSDDSLTTHQYVLAGIKSGLDLSTGELVTQYLDSAQRQILSSVVSIDYPEAMMTILGVKPEDHTKFAKFVYRKFGARPRFDEAPGLTSLKGQFFYALYLFMVQWAYQYRADVPTTFMPEAWPGMILQLPAFGFQGYISSVQHSGSMGEGGGFQTSISLVAPAYMPGPSKKGKPNPLVGLPIAGGYIKPSGYDAPTVPGDIPEPRLPPLALNPPPETSIADILGLTEEQ